MEMSRTNILLPMTIAMLSATLSIQAFASDPIGGVTLLSKDNAPCGFTPPAEGSGETFSYATNSPAYDCYPSKIRSVRFDRLPSAMEIIVSSQRTCNTSTAKEDEYWIKFKTTATNTGSPNIYSFEELQTYAKGQTIFRGLKVVDKKTVSGEKMRDATVCVKLIASGDIDTPAPKNLLTLKDSEGLDWQKESESPNRECPGEGMISLRVHNNGDENKATRYECRVADGYQIKDRKWSVPFGEYGREDDYIYFTCPTNTVMTGRWHTGDEEGYTRYQCASLVNSSGQAVQVEPLDWSEGHKESGGHSEACGTNQIMIGRAHEGDENGQTRYLCANLRPAAQ